MIYFSASSSFLNVYFFIAISLIIWLIISFCNFKSQTFLSFSVINKILSIIGTRLDAIIIMGLIKDNPIDNEIDLVLKIKRAYLHILI